MIPPAVALTLGLVVAWAILTVAIRATLNGFGFEPWSLALAVQVAACAYGLQTQMCMQGRLDAPA